MGQRLGALQRTLNKIVEQHLQEKLPDVLYHYTTWDGFRGIVQSQRFWATDHRDTNDDDEFQSADETIKAIAAELRSSTPPSARPALDQFIEKYRDTRVRTFLVAYLTCFSEARDSALQWNRYADGGRGVCLGVRVLDETFMDEHEARIGRSFRRVRYSELEWRTDVDAAFRAVQDQYKYYIAQNGDSREAKAEAWSALSELAAIASMSAKTARWASEMEWRQIAIPSIGYDPPLNTPLPDGKRRLSLAVRAPGLLIDLSEVMLGLRCPHSDEEAGATLAAAGYGDNMPPAIRSSVVPE